MPQTCRSEPCPPGGLSRQFAAVRDSVRGSVRGSPRQSANWHVVAGSPAPPVLVAHARRRCSPTPPRPVSACLPPVSGSLVWREHAPGASPWARCLEFTALRCPRTSAVSAAVREAYRAPSVACPWPSRWPPTPRRRAWRRVTCSACHTQRCRRHGRLSHPSVVHERRMVVSRGETIKSNLRRPARPDAPDARGVWAQRVTLG